MDVNTTSIQAVQTAHVETPMTNFARQVIRSHIGMEATAVRILKLNRELLLSMNQTIAFITNMSHVKQPIVKTIDALTASNTHICKAVIAVNLRKILMAALFIMEVQVVKTVLSLYVRLLLAQGSANFVPLATRTHI